jgi:hypothetical protein
MTELAHLLDQYIASRRLAPASLESDGVLAFEMADGPLMYASVSGTGLLELFATAGYLSAAQLAAMAEDEEEEEEDEADHEVATVLMRRDAHGAAWTLEANRETGLVTLSWISPELPRDLEGLAVVLQTLREVHATWAPRLQTEPPVPCATRRRPPASCLQEGYVRI